MPRLRAADRRLPAPPLLHPTPAETCPAVTRADDLTPRLFRALYPGHDLRTVHGTYIVTPKGTLVLISDSLGWIARQLAAGQPPAPAGPPPPAPSGRSNGNQDKETGS
jgi:hypothetical protein